MTRPLWELPSWWKQRLAAGRKSSDPYNINQHSTNKTTNTGLHSIRFTMHLKGVSINMYHIKKRNGFVTLSRQGRTFQFNVRKAAKAIRHHYGQVKGDVTVYLVFGFKDKRELRDPDNYPKPFFDGIKNEIMQDDHHIQSFFAEKKIRQPEDFIGCCITSLGPATSDGSGC